MKIPSKLVLLFVYGVSASVSAAQQTYPSPLGVVVEPAPAIRLPSELRRLLPRNAQTRILTQTKLAPEGETLIVYDVPEGISEPHPHIAFIRSARIVKDYAFERFMEGGEDFIAIGVLPFLVDGRAEAVAIAFRNIGDGATTIFVVFKASEASYQRILWAPTARGRLKVFQADKAHLELWNARLDVRWSDKPWNTCTWCQHRYEIETFEWRGDKFVRVSKRLTPAALDPAKISARPFWKSQFRYQR